MSKKKHKKIVKILKFFKDLKGGGERAVALDEKGKEVVIPLNAESRAHYKKILKTAA